MEFVASARWYHRETPNEVLIEIRHEDEAPIIIRPRKPMSTDTILDQVVQHGLALFGPLSSVTYDWYWYTPWDAGLVWVLLDTETYENADAAQKMIRPTMLRVAKAFKSKFSMGHVDTSTPLARDWLLSELGITQSDIPAMVVQKKAGRGPNFIYRGAMTDSHITQFLNDVLDGCLGYQHPLQNFGGLAKVQQLETCDTLVGGGVAQCKEWKYDDTKIDFLEKF